MIVKNKNFNTTTLEILEKLKNEQYFTKGFRNSGDNIIAQCPIHKEGRERTPSGGFRKDDGFFHCFSCGASMPLFMVIEKIAKVEATKWLNNYFSYENIKISNVIPQKREVKLSQFVDEKELNNYNHFHPYMAQRKLTPEVINKFKVGFDDKTNSLTFPVRDEKGNIVFIARRSVQTKFFNYPKDVEKPLYGLFEIYREIKSGKVIDEVYITESIIDALTIWGYGKYAIALNGTGSKEQYQMINRLPFRNLILALDNDEAGQKGIKKLKLNTNKIYKQVIFPKDKKDINDLTIEEFNNLEKVLKL